jgi:hypothetical protein
MEPQSPPNEINISEHRSRINKENHNRWSARKFFRAINFKPLSESKRDLHDDLMAYLYHPSRIEKWLNDGNEVEEYLI